MTKRKYTKKQQAVILDYDDCCVGFLSFLCFLHNKLHNTCISEHDVKAWSFAELDITDIRGNRVTGEELFETFKKYEKDGLYAALPAIKEARLGIDLIHKLGYKVIILTARKPEYETQTILNMVKNKIHCDEIYFESDKVKKIKELSKTYNIQLFADDKLSTVEAVAENCNVKHNCVVRMAHNENAEISDDILMIPSIFDAVRYLKDLEE